MRLITLKVDDDLFEMIEDYARRRGITRSEAVRRALKSFVMNDRDRPFITKRIKIYT